MERCRGFHSEWMERAPDTEVMHALDRRKQFPVALLVMAHDNIAIMRPSLEGVALVVEHIVSVKGYQRKLGNAGLAVNSRVAHASPSVCLESFGVVSRAWLVHLILCVFVAIPLCTIGFTSLRHAVLHAIKARTRIQWLRNGSCCSMLGGL